MNINYLLLKHKNVEKRIFTFLTLGINFNRIKNNNN